MVNKNLLLSRCPVLTFGAVLVNLCSNLTLSNADHDTIYPKSLQQMAQR